jgi:hypothetical protein
VFPNPSHTPIEAKATELKKKRPQKHLLTLGQEIIGFI